MEYVTNCISSLLLTFLLLKKIHSKSEELQFEQYDIIGQLCYMGTITNNFSYREFEVSATASRCGICNVITDSKVRDNVKELTETILQPLRTAWGSGLNITSGYRCTKLNALVGGAKTSAHQYGLAADIVPSNGKIDEFILFAERWLNDNGVMFDQSINEKDRKGNHWWHIGLRNSSGMQRRQFMVLTKKDVKRI